MNILTLTVQMSDVILIGAVVLTCTSCVSLYVLWQAIKVIGLTDGREDSKYIVEEVERDES